jgi:hypothetical protein
MAVCYKCKIDKKHHQMIFQWNDKVIEQEIPLDDNFFIYVPNSPNQEFVICISCCVEMFKWILEKMEKHD